MFDELSDKLDSVLGKLRQRGVLTEPMIRDGLREVRRVLLEADVNYKVTRDFLNRVQEKALGEEVLKSVSPGQQIVKIVHDELVSLLGSSASQLNLFAVAFSSLSELNTASASSPSALISGAHIIDRIRKSTMLSLISNRVSFAASAERIASREAMMITGSTSRVSVRAAEITLLPSDSARTNTARPRMPTTSQPLSAVSRSTSSRSSCCDCSR